MGQVKNVQEEVSSVLVETTCPHPTIRTESAVHLYHIQDMVLNLQCVRKSKEITSWYKTLCKPIVQNCAVRASMRFRKSSLHKSGSTPWHQRHHRTSPTLWPLQSFAKGIN